MPPARKATPGPPRDREVRGALAAFLWQKRDDPPRVQDIQERVVSLGKRRPARQSVYNWLKFWTETGFLRDGRAQEEPPEQTYLLLLDVREGASTAARLRSVLQPLQVEEPEEIAGVFNWLARVRARDPSAVRDLARHCRRAGARDARVLLAEHGA